MKITAKAANTYGYAAIAVMAVLLALVLLRIVPQYLNWWLFAVALALYLVRITLRLVIARQARMDQHNTDEQDGQPSGQGPNG
jgi:hypothetical protein